MSLAAVTTPVVSYAVSWTGASPTAGPASGSDHPLWSDLMAWQVPPLEKVVRTVVVYLAIALILRLAGKRQLAQLSTFDLVVALLLSNVVQNAIIGDDNSLVGGLLGAVVLVASNALVNRICLVSATADRLFNGSDTTIVEDGRVDEKALRTVGLSRHELVDALRKQGADDIAEVSRSDITPGGTITMSLRREEQNASQGELEAAVARLEAHLDRRLDELATRLGSGHGSTAG